MAKREFLTVPDELLECAEIVTDWFEARGHSLKIEHNEMAYPYRPTLRCKRERTTLLVEVAITVDIDRAGEWARYGKSAIGDTRVALVVPSDLERKPSEDKALRALGVGLYEVSGSDVTEVMPPMDLALNLAPPDLKNLPPRVRRVVGSAYDQFDRSQWREGFEEICQALERAARAHLQKDIKTGRVSLRRASGKAWNPTQEQVGKMPLGALAEAYAAILNPSHVDAVTGTALKKLNKDRVGVAHYKGLASAETRLRKNVGQNIWLAINTLRVLLG
jgi:hypothetical protein